MAQPTCNGVPQGNSVPQPCSASFITLNYPQGVDGSYTFLTGVRGDVDSPDIYVSGVYNYKTIYQGLIYKGSLNGCGQWYSGTFPGSTATQFYGPNSLGNEIVQIVGTYSTDTVLYSGLLYQGKLDWSGEWKTVNPQILDTIPIRGTIVHSIMGNYAVGTYFHDGGATNESIALRAFVYGLQNNDYYAIPIPHARNVNAYGIWHNGNSSYTIVGGYNPNFASVNASYIIDFDSSTNTFSNAKSYSHDNDPSTPHTHFEGITSDGHGGYNIASNYDIGISPTYTAGNVIDDGLLNAYTNTNGTEFVNIARNPDGTFADDASWYPYLFTYSNGSTVNLFTSSNTVYQNTILGVYSNNGVVSGYIGTFNPSCLAQYNIMASNQTCLTPIPSSPAEMRYKCVIKYQELNYPGHIGTTALTGMRAAANNTNDVLISGYYTNLDLTNGGFIYKGLLSNQCGTFFDFNFPSSNGVTVNSTRAFGVDNVFNDGLCRVIGDYMTVETGPNHLGFFYHGTVDGKGEWDTVSPQSLEPNARVLNTNVLSTIGEVVVGFYNTDTSSDPRGYLYQTNNQKVYSVVYPGSAGTSVTGAWYNWFYGKFSLPEYTIVGTYNNADGFTAGFIADWNFTGSFAYNFQSYSANNDQSTTIMTEFSSIANDHLVSNTTGGYNIVANWQDNKNHASLVNIQRAQDGGFGYAEWINYEVTGSSYTNGASNNNLNSVVGFYSKAINTQYGYIATIPEKCIFSYLDSIVYPKLDNAALVEILNNDFSNINHGSGQYSCSDTDDYIAYCTAVKNALSANYPVSLEYFDHFVAGCTKAILDCINS